MKRKAARIAARDLNASFIGAHLTIHGWSTTGGQRVEIKGVLSDISKRKGSAQLFVDGRIIAVGDDVAIDVEAPE